MDGFSSSFGFFLGVSFWMEDDLWLQREARWTDEHKAGGAEEQEEMGSREIEPRGQKGRNRGRRKSLESRREEEWGNTRSRRRSKTCGLVI